MKLVSARSGAPKSASPKRSSAKRAAAEGPARLLSVTRGDERFEFRDRLPLLPLRDVVVFPYMTVPLLVGRAPSVHAIERAASRDKILFVTAQKRSEVTDPSHEELYRIGTVVRLLQLFRLPDGTLRVLVEGLCRARAERFQWSRDAYVVRLEPLPDPVAASAEGEALMRTVAHQFGDYVHLHRRIPDEVLNSASGITDPITLGHTVSAQLLVKVPIKQQLLEAETPVERLRMLGQTLASELEILKLERKIEGQVRSQVHKNQKEFYLNEQLKAIRKELGHQNEFASELDELGTAIKRARMPREVQAKAIKELDRLSKMSFMSPEATVVRNYVDWLVSLPWSKTTRDHADVSAVERILDEDHYGLRKVKDRIVEYLAVLQLTGRLRGPILCFVGPPGVGKTSLGRSIARALGRKFVRMALGGVRDEAEIRGHRRTYIGSMPGRVVQSLKRAGSRNPVFLLDEIDKLGADFRGDPASALLEVLDPEQNHTFNDHYLEVDFDLSQVMFLCTANSISGIPLALADRMEIIRLPGYLEHEKVAIARDFLLPKQREAAGLAERDVKLPVETLQAIANGWTREAGVRSFERELAAICRKVARKRAAGEAKRGITVTPDQLTRYLGPVRYLDSKIEQRSRIGVANGLAWTDTGGDVLTIEVSVVPGKGELLLTGKLGEVMRESGQAAMSYLRSRAKVLGLEKWFYRELDIHVHVPEGAMPKDGPSAGITMATALVSALTGIATRPEVGMTGEITLRGTVLPIGGLAEKSVAARRAGLTTVLIPLANAKDLEEIAPEIRREVEFVTVESMDDVLMRALERSPLVASNETEPAPAVVTPAPPATPAAGDAPPVAH
ncbi:MAG: endopeptidase La [Candidatus Eisenbacteria bacterium]|uniref:Lon protease n=1 Tax=Eiseniibacteriota bacterium TaxID=2212470 RepID=A0A849SMB5_UNCEI|nr:endopeptidase La [Candidatus Eisenbacteria bacterium]